MSTAERDESAPVTSGPHYIREGRWCATWRTAKDDGGGIVWGTTEVECAALLSEATGECAWAGGRLSPLAAGFVWFSLLSAARALMPEIWIDGRATREGGMETIFDKAASLGFKHGYGDLSGAFRLATHFAEWVEAVELAAATSGHFTRDEVATSARRRRGLAVRS
jgi:hypothetical protein